MEEIEIILSKRGEVYFLTDSTGNAYDASWNQIQEILKIYINNNKKVVIKPSCYRENDTI